MPARYLRNKDALDQPVKSMLHPVHLSLFCRAATQKLIY
jgi:hypothetical protein